MLRQKEFMEQLIHLQQPRAIQTNVVRIGHEKSLLIQLPQRSGEALFYIDAELLLKVTLPDASQLHLQNHFTNQTLVMRRTERAANGKNTFANLVAIARPLVFVLKVRALHMREGRDAYADHVGARP